jgi:spore maturation protein CgeB
MKAAPSIAFFGSSLVSAYWNGAATYYRGLLRALARHGAQITFYEPDAFQRQQHRDMADPDWATVVVYPGDDDGAALAMVERASDADLIVKASGVGVYDALLERAVLELRNPGGAVFFWDVDAPATLARLHADPTDPFRTLVPRFDAICTYGGGQPVIDAYRALGAAECVPVYNALDPETHHPTAPDPRFEADLGFLGNRLPDREARVEMFFLDAARRASERSFVLGGSGWDDKALPANVRNVGHVYTHQHNAFNCTPRMVLNVSRDSMAATGFSPATRVFEAAGAGACLITDAWEGIALFVEPGTEVLVAHDGEEVADHLERIDAKIAASIGARARRRVLAEHTYDHRAAQVLEMLSGERLAAAGRQTT